MSDDRIRPSSFIRNAVGGVLRKPFEVGTLPELIARL